MAVSALFPAVFHRNSVPKKSAESTLQGFHYSAELSAPFAEFCVFCYCPFRGSEWNAVKKKCFLKSSECFSLSFNGFERVSKSCFFRLMLPSKISSFFLFCKLFRNSEWFILPRNGLVLNSERFPFRETDRIPTELIKISVCSMFHGIIFFSENGHPTLEHVCLF